MKNYTAIEEGCIPCSASLTPRVSVVVPTYNTEDYLDQALSSIEAQTLTNIEIIIVNDGCTDGSRDIMEAHAKRDGRIRIIDKENGGYGAGCNRGIAEARGEWISIIEPDDFIDPGMYKDMTDYAALFAETIDIVKTPFYLLWMPDTPEEEHLNCDYHLKIKPTKQPFTVEDPGFVTILGHHPSIWSALYRREFLLENDIRFPEYPGSGWADNPFLIETYCKAKNIIYLSQAYYNYRGDTPEQLEAFALKNTLLPLDRWQTMMDMLEEYGVKDHGVLLGHYSRGFTYLSGIVEVVDFTHPEVREAAIAMFDRMDDRLVFGDPTTSPAWKRKYAELKGVECPPISAIPYGRELIKKGLRTMANVGPLRTWRSTRGYAYGYKSRTGQGALPRVESNLHVNAKRRAQQESGEGTAAAAPGAASANGNDGKPDGSAAS